MLVKVKQFRSVITRAQKCPQKIDYYILFYSRYSSPGHNFSSHEIKPKTQTIN